MASGKRASMREGPLAALFRRTDEEETPATEAPSAAAEPAAPPARETPRAAEAPPTQPAPTAPPPPVEIEEPRLPTPQERLRHAFSSDIPDDILERPADEPYEDAPEPRAATDEPSPWGQAKPVGQPVLRVVGVGGAGV